MFGIGATWSRSNWAGHDACDPRRSLRPAAKVCQQNVERLPRNRLVWEMAHRANRLTHLIEIDPAVGAAREVLIETRSHVAGQRTFEVVGHELDEHFTRQFAICRVHRS